MQKNKKQNLFLLASPPDSRYLSMIVYLLPPKNKQPHSSIAGISGCRHQICRNLHFFPIYQKVSINMENALIPHLLKIIFSIYVHNRHM